MRGFDSILVPIDFSDPSAKILNTALRASSDDGKLTLLHVVEYLPLVTESFFGVYPHRKEVEQIKDLSRQKLEAAARQHPDHTFELVVREGKPASAILEAVAEIGPDLVVMGTHGRSRLDHLLIGSVAERVVRKAPCNVLLVHVDPRE